MKVCTKCNRSLDRSKFRTRGDYTYPRCNDCYNGKKRADRAPTLKTIYMHGRKCSPVCRNGHKRTEENTRCTSTRVYCYDCMNERAARKKELASQETRRCNRCARIRPCSDFDKWRTYCRRCEKEAREAPGSTYFQDVVRIPVPGWGYFVEKTNGRKTITKLERGPDENVRPVRARGAYSR